MKFGRKIKNHFIPHKGNDYKPHFLRNESMLAIFLLIIVVELAFLAQIFIVFDKTKFLAAVLPGVLTSLTNDVRIDNNIGTLTPNPLLEKAAQMKADDMASRGYFAHNTPDGKTPWYFLEQVGYKYSYAGENLAVNFFESPDVSRAWMNSPSHRANIIKNEYTEIGIAVASGIYEGKNTVFVVQFFGTPAKTNAVPATTTSSTPSNAKPITQKAPTTVVKTKTQTTTPKTQNTINPAKPTPTPILTQVLGEESTKQISSLTSYINEVKLFFEKILTSPSIATNKFLILALAIIAFCLIMLIILGTHVQNSALLTRGVLMVSVIILLLYVNINIVHFDTKLPKLEANAIEFAN